MKQKKKGMINKKCGLINVLRPCINIQTPCMIRAKYFYEAGLSQHKKGFIELHPEVKEDYEDNLKEINNELALRN